MSPGARRGAKGWDEERLDRLGAVLLRKRMFIELMTSDRQLKASREGSKSSNTVVSVGQWMPGCAPRLTLNPEP